MKNKSNALPKANLKKQLLSTGLVLSSLFVVAGCSLLSSDNQKNNNPFDSNNQNNSHHKSIKQIQAEQNKKFNAAVKNCQFSSNHTNNIKALKLLSKAISIGFYDNPRGYDNAINVINTIKDWSVVSSHSGFDNIKNKIIASAKKQKANATMDWDQLQGKYYAVFRGYYAHTDGETKYKDSTQFETDPTTNPTLDKNTYLMPYFDLLKVKGTQDQYDTYVKNLGAFKTEQTKYANHNSPLDNSIVGSGTTFDGSSLNQIFNAQETNLVNDTKNPNNPSSNNFSYTANNKKLVNTIVLDTGANGVPYYGYVYSVNNGGTQSYWISAVIGGFVFWMSPNDQTTTPDLSKGIKNGYIGLPIFSDRFASNFFNSQGYKLGNRPSGAPSADQAVNYHHITNGTFSWTHSDSTTLVIDFKLDSVASFLPPNVPFVGSTTQVIKNPELKVTISNDNLSYDSTTLGLTQSAFAIPTININATIALIGSIDFDVQNYSIYYDTYGISGFTSPSDKNVQFSVTKNYFVLNMTCSVLGKKTTLGKSVVNAQLAFNPITGGSIYANDMGAADDTMPGQGGFNLAGAGVTNGKIDPNTRLKIFAGTQNVYANFDPTQGDANKGNWPITFSANKPSNATSNKTSLSRLDKNIIIELQTPFVK